MRWIVLVIALFAALPAAAVKPDEMLEDPALEARARALDHELRCVKCQSESIASSNADWARDARIISRELIADGATDEEVKAFFVDRYGEYVLMNPRFSAQNALLWLAGPILLLAGGGVAYAFIRRPARRAEGGAGAAPLSPEEKSRLDRLLQD